MLLMIKPNELPPQPVLTQRQRLEREFDTAIVAAYTSGDWPAIVTHVYGTDPAQELQSMAQVYRLAGWTDVQVRGTVCLIWPT